tara:strand:+ start:9961 stop:10338 length:378 start_codon:yes stop_codon:yes gene_type:complete
VTSKEENIRIKKVHKGLIFLIKTNLSYKFVHNEFHRIQQENNQSLSFFVCDLSEFKLEHLNAVFNFSTIRSNHDNNQDTTGISGLFEKKERKKSLNELLDKISSKGIKSLSSNELEQLRIYSEKL